MEKLVLVIMVVPEKYEGESQVQRIWSKGANKSFNNHYKILNGAENGAKWLEVKKIVVKKNDKKEDIIDEIYGTIDDSKCESVYITAVGHGDKSNSSLKYWVGSQIIFYLTGDINKNDNLLYLVNEFSDSDRKKNFFTLTFVLANWGKIVFSIN